MDESLPAGEDCPGVANGSSLLVRRFAPPDWPSGNGLPIVSGKSFSASFGEATWFNFELSAAGLN